MAFKNPIVYLSQLVADTITGAKIQTAASGTRWVMGGTTADLQGYTGDANESSPAQISLRNFNPGGQLKLLITSAVNAVTGRFAQITLVSTNGSTSVSLSADGVVISANGYTALLADNTGTKIQASPDGGVNFGTVAISPAGAITVMPVAGQAVTINAGAAGGSLALDGAGNITATPATGKAATINAGAAGGSLALDGAGNITATPATGKAITLAGKTLVGASSPASGAINSGIDMGKVTGVTTSGSGGVLVTHGLGVVPTSVQITPFMAAANVGWRVTAMTTTNFTIGFFTCSTGAALVSTNVGFTWEVKA